MKRKNIFRISSLAFLTAAIFTSCSDSFLEEKQNYDSTTREAYNYWSGASARVLAIYRTCLPDAAANASARFNCTGLADDQSKSTEEYSGFSVFVNPQAPLTYQTGNNPVPDYFQGTKGNPLEGVYGRIRDVNDVIIGVTESTLSQDEKDQLLGQAYFLRAWCYYNLVKWYGGVPIVTDVLEPIASSVVPRSSTKACIDFICDDLNTAETLLARFTGSGQWMSGENYGRVTSGAAVALLGRVRLLYASPMFNRTNDVTRWTQAYEDIKRSIGVLTAAGYGLANESNPGINASGWASMFSQVPNTEGIFVTLYNTLVQGTPDYRKNNTWEHGIRPNNTLGGGGKTPSAMLVDMFPMRDGKVPGGCNTYTKLDKSESDYNPQFPFIDRDPRFYRTFAFPGVRWTFTGDPRNDNNDNPYNGTDYELWNYVWYTSPALRDDITANSEATYGADNLLNNVKGFYVRKRSDDRDVNSTSRYEYTQASGFTRSASPYMEIRFAEVLLNYAEAACGAGHLDEAVAQLQRIRARVGYTAENNYGLQANLSGDAAACMAAILYERQIELAYEGKRFDDLRRWMLFDGGTVLPDGAPSSWRLTGWDGNTCSYLGFTPLNGQRRENLEFRVKIDSGQGEGIGGTTLASDPLTVAGVTRPAALDLRNDLSTQTEALREFYNANLIRKTKKGDSYNDSQAELYIEFLPRYYFLGFNQGIQSSATTLTQTIGWGDYMNGGSNGTFDPLEE